MTDILDLPDWTLLAKHHDDDEYELEAEYRLLPGACVKCGSVGRLYKHGTKDETNLSVGNVVRGTRDFAGLRRARRTRQGGRQVNDAEIDAAIRALAD